MGFSSASDYIASVSDLEAALGRGFALIAGSAVSGVCFPYLPMVTVTKTIMESLGNKFDISRYSDYLHACYARRISGGFGHILKDTLFEEFLGEIVRSSSRGVLDSLLRSLYYCDIADFGPNHEAIARLLQSESCRVCLTTNFDNAIERACESTGVEVEVWDVVKHQNYPDKLVRENSPPFLIKMHGCVTNNTCVAESRQILAAASELWHRHLEARLKGYRVLVVGYSGVGDIDITRHFKKTAAAFVFARHQVNGAVPTWAARCALCDLSGSPASTIPNLLCGIAGVDAASIRTLTRRDENKLVREWLQSSQIEAKYLISSLLKWRRATDLLRLRHAEHRQCHSGTLGADTVLLHLQRGAYKTAFRICQELITQPQSADQLLNIASMQAFALWRMGQWKRARENSYMLLEQVGAILRNPAKLLNTPFEEYCFNICRVYIELCMDELHIMPSRQVLQVAESWEIQKAYDMLKVLHHPNPQDHYLFLIAGCQVDWLNGQQGVVDRLASIFRDCMDRQYLNTAWLAVRLTLRISLKTGIRDYVTLNRALKDIHRSHYIWKNRESLFIGLMMGSVKKPGVLRYRLMKDIITLLYALRTGYVEIRHRDEVWRWTMQRKKWTTLKGSS